MVLITNETLVYKQPRHCRSWYALPAAARKVRFSTYKAKASSRIKTRTFSSADLKRVWIKSIFCKRNCYLVICEKFACFVTVMLDRVLMFGFCVTDCRTRVCVRQSRFFPLWWIFNNVDFRVTVKAVDITFPYYFFFTLLPCVTGICLWESECRLSFVIQSVLQRTCSRAGARSRTFFTDVRWNFGFTKLNPSCFSSTMVFWESILGNSLGCYVSNLRQGII